MQQAQEANPSFSNQKAAHFKAIAGSFVCIGRLLSILALRKIKARQLLLLSSFLTLALTAAATGARGPPRLYLIMAEHFSKACVAPIIDSLALRGLGKHTKKGASAIVMTVCALAVFAPLFGVVADKTSLRIATALPTACAAFVSIFAVVVNGYLARPLDALCEGKHDRADVEHAERQDETQSSLSSESVTPLARLGSDSTEEKTFRARSAGRV